MPARTHIAKIRKLNTQADKLARQLSRVQAQIEVQEAAATARLEREIARVERQCGVSAKKTAAKKTSKKRTAKKAPTVEVILPSNASTGKKAKKKAAKKAAKKASKKKSGKKAGKK